MSNSIVLGIDLGTTNSYVSYLWSEQLEILENSQGERKTLSCIFFGDKGSPIIGKYAHQMGANRPRNCIYDIKRFIGKSFYDPQFKEDLKYFTFDIGDDFGKPVVLLETAAGPLKKSATELASLILRKIKIDSEKKLGEPVDKVVLTVPAYYKSNQRKAILEAAKLADLTVLKLLNEPTAVALNYYYLHKDEYTTGSYVLVYDLGGGTFDVSVVKNHKKGIDVIDVDGDSHLGGNDFDQLIMDYLLDELHTKYDCDLSKDKRTLRRLRTKSEEHKKILSAAKSTVIILEGFSEKDNIITIELTREKFESMAMHLIDRTMDIVKRCLENCKLQKKEIADVIVAGGSTRIPKIQQVISQFFDEKQLNKFLNPDECVAKGAAVQAAMLSKHPKQKVNPVINISQVVPLSLGFESVGGKMNVIIRRNSKIPVSEQVICPTTNNNQKSMVLQLYEGERTEAVKNYFLGTCRIENLTPAPPGKCLVKCTISVDENGILTVLAQEENNNNTKQLVVSYISGIRSDAEIRDADSKGTEDEQFLRFVDAKTFLYRYCVKVIYNFQEKNLDVAENQANIDILSRCMEIKALVTRLDIKDAEQILSLKAEIVKKCAPLVARYKFKDMPKEN